MSLIGRASDQDRAALVTRRQKLLSAGAVLGVGAALAWPLRRSEPLPASRLNVGPPAANDRSIADARAAAPPVADTAKSSTAPPAAVAAPDGDPFAAAPGALAAGGESAPTFSTVSHGAPMSPPSAETVAPPGQIHVVHEGDSLNRLAKRYLGDEARALEIFDLNRDVLDNPHVLRIGVELRIPVAEGAGE